MEKIPIYSSIENVIDMTRDRDYIEQTDTQLVDVINQRIKISNPKLDIDQFYINDLVQFITDDLDQFKLITKPIYSQQFTVPLTSLTCAIDMQVNGGMCKIAYWESDGINVEIPKKHIIDIWLETLAYKRDLLFIHVYNLYDGTRYTIKIGCKDPFEALTMICEAKDVYITNMDMFYDIETNGLIQDERADKPVYPFPLQICGKEYHSGMTVIPEILIKLPASHVFNKDAYAIHNISEEMLDEKGKSLDEARDYIEHRLRRVKGLCPFAHNGRRFDNPIVKHYRLFDPFRVSAYYDTIDLMKHHLTKLKMTQFESYSIANLVKKFDIDLESVLHDKPRHTAEADVDLLLYIFKSKLS